MLDVQYDALMIDEAQDLDNRWLDSLTCLLSDPKKSPVWLFMDDNQNVYGSTLDVPDEYRPFELSVNCRNTHAIHREVMKKYVGLGGARGAGPGGTNAGADPCRGSGARRWRGSSSGCAERRRSRPRTWWCSPPTARRTREIYNDGLPGRFPLTDKRPAPAGKVFFSSIRGFKGLESSVVVLCELEDLEEETIDQQLYVGFSRAKTHCVVIAPG